MMKLRKMSALLLAMCVLMLAFSACGQTNAPATTPDAATPSVTDVPSVEPSASPDSDPLGKYDPPIEISVGLRTTSTDTYAMDGTNPWGKKYAEYGINIKVLWTVDASQYESKLNTLISAGDIPDLFTNISPQQMNVLRKSDMIADLTDILNNNLSPEAKELMLGSAAKNAINAVTYDGRIMFLPQNISENQADAFPLFIRLDWLKNLNLEIPKTLDDLKKIAIAFTKNDPDGNKKNDTYGLAIAAQKSLLTDWGGLYGFFPAYGVQPCVWYDGMLFYSKDASGKAVWDGTRPEVKEGFQLLADLYKEGAIPSDFATMDSSRVTAELNGSKAGMVFGARGLPFWAIQNTIKNDPKAEWYAMNMPTKDGSHPPIFGWQPVNVAGAVSNKCKNPEAIAKMINIQYKYGYRKSPDLDPILGNRSDINVAGPRYYDIYDPTEERDMFNAFFDAIKAKDKSKLSASWQADYDKYMKYEESKDPDCWGIWNGGNPAPGGAFYTVWQMNTPEDVKNNVWWSLPTDEIVSKMQLFKKMAEEEVIKIISGDVPVSDWDNFVQEWNKIGGDEVTRIVNENMK